MKKFLITAVISSMLLASAGASAAEDGGARLSGIYSALNEVRVIADDIQSVEWSASRTETGTYTPIGGETGDTYFVSYDYAGYWIKASVTDSEGNVTETEPRMIEKPWSSRRKPGNISGSVPQTPSKSLFTVDGMDFVLLDVTEDEESKFLVITKDSVGYRWITEGTTVQSVYDMMGFLNSSDEVVYYINETDSPDVYDNAAGYDQTGYIGNEGYTQLPSSVLEFVNFEQVWKTEPTATGQSKERAYKGGITLPSYQDMMNYADKIGWKNEEKDKNSFVSFWLRTPSTSGKILYANADISGNIADKQITSPDGSVAIRPMFYLGRDFFINNKPENPGQDILNAMWTEYTKDELLSIYTQDELTALGYIDFTIDSVLIASDESGYYADVTISSRMSENKDMTVLVAAYDAEGMLSGVNIDTVPCSAGQNKKAIRLEGVTADNYSSAMAVIIDSAENPAPIYKAFFTK